MLIRDLRGRIDELPSRDEVLGNDVGVGLLQRPQLAAGLGVQLLARDAFGNRRFVPAFTPGAAALTVVALALGPTEVLPTTALVAPKVLAAAALVPAEVLAAAAIITPVVPPLTVAAIIPAPVAALEALPASGAVTEAPLTALGAGAVSAAAGTLVTVAAAARAVL
nr:hypothetical protein GCM10023233_08890 [Brevibacterium otitidis]